MGQGFGVASRAHRRASRTRLRRPKLAADPSGGLCFNAGMCGRYTLTLRGETFVHELDEVRIELKTLAPRYNLSPGQTAPVIRLEDGRPAVATLRWGLVPFWAKDPKIAFQCINARSEGIAAKPAFRAAFKKRRCLIPADGFYEWQKEGSAKLPWRFVRPDGQLFLFAGLWESWQPAPDQPVVETYTVITTTPNAVTGKIHDRMPVIVDSASAKLWLDPTATAAQLESVLKPAPDNLLTVYRVSPVVNNSRNESPVCIEPLAEG